MGWTADSVGLFTRSAAALRDRPPRPARCACLGMPVFFAAHISACLPSPQLWIMLPSSAYTMLWMTGLSVAALVVVGIKLQVRQSRLWLRMRMISMGGPAGLPMRCFSAPATRDPLLSM